MRRTVSLIALLLASPALAEDVFTQAPVVAVEVYPDGATMTLRADVELPAGTHRVFLPFPDAGNLDSLPRVRASDGVTIGALGLQEVVSADPRDFYTPAQDAAAQKVDAAQDAIAAKQDEIDVARAGVEALEARAEFLANVTPPEEGTPDQVLAMADLVATQMQATRADLATAQAGLRPLREERKDLEAALAEAQHDLDRLDPPQGSEPMLAVEVIVAQGGPVALEVTEGTWDAGWGLEYDLDLDRVAQALAIDRKVVLFQDTGRVWSDASVTLSTARPSDQVAPRPVTSDQASIYEPQPRKMAMEDSMASLAPAPMIEPEVIVESAVSRTAVVQADGLSLSYIYPDPVNVVSGEVASLALDSLSLAARPFVQAAPRYDDTAFLMAEITNTLGEPLLPGQVRLSRDGAFVGEARLPMIPANATQDLAFGPIEGIRLETLFKRNAEGDAGLITKSSTRRQEITVSVENLTDEAQEVRTLFPLTYSEQEDLDVRVVATPAPDESDVEDRRGVSAWNLDLAPGETGKIEIIVDLDWPEGQILNWRP